MITFAQKNSQEMIEIKTEATQLLHQLEQVIHFYYFRTIYFIKVRHNHNSEKFNFSPKNFKPRSSSRFYKEKKKKTLSCKMWIKN